MSDEQKIKPPRTALLHEGGDGWKTTLGAVRQWLLQADALGYEDDQPVALHLGSISVSDDSNRLYADPSPGID